MKATILSLMPMLSATEFGTWKGWILLGVCGSSVGVVFLDELDVVAGSVWMVPRYGNAARFFPRCCVFRQNCG